MSRTSSGPWLFFLFNLPGTRASERVKFWRRLKKFGAIQLKTSAYVLPDEPVHYERFQWLGKEIVDVGGEATLARAAWRKLNRLSQRKAVAVLGKHYFHVTFASLRSWEEGRRSPNPHTAGILEKFLSDHPTVERPKK